MTVGVSVGTGVDVSVGTAVGTAVGWRDGVSVGTAVGVAVGVCMEATAVRTSAVGLGGSVPVVVDGDCEQAIRTASNQQSSSTMHRFTWNPLCRQKPER